MHFNHYLKIGSGRKNIIFLHGWRENKEIWINVAEYLKYDFTCWLIDLPGFGENPKSNHILTPQDYARFIKDFIREMKIEEYFFVGHSFGGRVGICFASLGERGLKKLVLYGTPGFPEKIPFLKRAIISMYKNFNLKYFTNFRKNRIFKNIQNYLSSPDYLNADELKDVFMASITFDLKSPMDKIFVPTMIIHGKSDQEVSFWVAKKMKNQIKNSQLKVVDGTHFFHLENPILFSGYIRKFFDE